MDWRRFGPMMAPDGGGGAAGSGGGADGGAGNAAGAEAEARSEREYAERYGVVKRPRQPAQDAQPDDGARQQQDQQQVPTHVAFRDLIKGDEYKAEADEYIQGIIRDRFKANKANEQRIEALTPILSRVAEKYGFDVTDPAKIDLEALTNKLDEDTEGLEDEALEKGMSVETLAQMKRLERQNAEMKARESAMRQENEERAAFAQIAQQAENLKQIIPGFDISQEMQNRRFAQMVMPPSMRGAGMTVEEAYFAIHHDDMMRAGMQAAQQMTQRQVANAILSGSRPVENGQGGSGAPRSEPIDPGQLTREQLKAIRDRVKAGDRSISF